MVVDAVDVTAIMGAGMDRLVVDAVVVDVIMGLGVHSLVACFAVRSRNLAVVEVFIWML